MELKLEQALLCNVIMLLKIETGVSFGELSQMSVNGRREKERWLDLESGRMPGHIKYVAQAVITQNDLTDPRLRTGATSAPRAMYRVEGRIKY